jgi:3-keto-5-aminohexanoate cleavage enzyme
MTQMHELIIMVAPNGSRRSKQDHPRLPITPGELADDAFACQRAGASAIHLHVRDADGGHSLSAGDYRAAIAAIEARCGASLVTQVTTEAAGQFELARQIALVDELRPAAVSFSLTEMLRGGEATVAAFLDRAARIGTAIQFILYTPDEVRLFARLWRTPGMGIPQRPVLIIVVGRYSGVQESSVTEFDLQHAALVETGLAQASVWMTCAFGRGEMACLERSIALGGHARVGFENAIVDAAGHLARDNAERVGLVAEIAARHGRPLASAEDCARLLGTKGLAPLLA